MIDANHSSARPSLNKAYTYTSVKYNAYQDELDNALRSLSEGQLYRVDPEYAHDICTALCKMGIPPAYDKATHTLTDARWVVMNHTDKAKGSPLLKRLMDPFSVESKLSKTIDRVNKATYEKYKDVKETDNLHRKIQLVRLSHQIHTDFSRRFGKWAKWSSS